MTRQGLVRNEDVLPLEVLENFGGLSGCHCFILDDSARGDSGFAIYIHLWKVCSSFWRQERKALV